MKVESGAGPSQVEFTEEEPYESDLSEQQPQGSLQVPGVIAAAQQTWMSQGSPEVVLIDSDDDDEDREEELEQEGEEFEGEDEEEDMGEEVEEYEEYEEEEQGEEEEEGDDIVEVIDDESDAEAEEEEETQIEEEIGEGVLTLFVSLIFRVVDVATL